MKLSVTLTISFFTLIFIFIISGVVVVGGSKNLRDNLYSLNEESFPEIIFYEDLKILIKSAGIELRDLIFIDGYVQKQQIIDSLLNIDTLFEKQLSEESEEYEDLNEIVNRQDETEEIQDIQDLWVELKGKYIELINLKSNNLSFDSQLLYVLKQKEKEIINKIDQNLVFERNEFVLIKDNSTMIANRMIYFNIIMVFLTLIFAIVFSVFIPKIITRPVKEYVCLIDGLSKGNFNVKIPKNLKTFDEVRVLTDALDRVMTSMKLFLIRNNVKTRKKK